ncbi:DMT family transporter [Macrococcus armenti]|uniref:DMT family transporter n=1 Tax=Macrococcus armenti TaxID=2875764 RepID=UPI003B97C2CC
MIFWIYLVVAGLCEMLGVLWMNMYAKHNQRIYIVYLIITFGFSLFFLSLSLQGITMSTAYAIWTGIGAVGGTLIGIVFYKESKNPMRLLCIVVILGATIGLKLLS